MSSVCKLKTDSGLRSRQIIERAKRSTRARKNLAALPAEITLLEKRPVLPKPLHAQMAETLWNLSPWGWWYNVFTASPISKTRI